MPEQLKNSRKDLINIENEENECTSYQTFEFNGKSLQWINNSGKKEWLPVLIMEGIEIRVTKKQKIMSIDINVCRYENKKGYPICLSKETLENDMELL